MIKLKYFAFCLLIIFGCSTGDKNWYPFPNSFLGKLYTAGPIALTSNLNNETNIWQNINGLNTSIARMSYAMQLGVPEINIAWFLNDGSWPDEPNFQFRELNSNSKETQISKLINLNGYTYDRISKKNLLSSKISQNELKIGNASYSVLLINDLEHTSPDILEKILALANTGLDVIFIGEFPQRATGLSKSEIRDEEILTYIEKISKVVYQLSDPKTLAKILKELNIDPLINLLDKDKNYFRSAIRSCGSDKIIYFFNDSYESNKKNFHIDRSFTDVKILDPYTGDIKEYSNKNFVQKLTVSLEGGKAKILILGQGIDSNNINCFQANKWANPDETYFPILRWWWPGNAVEKMQIQKELKKFKKAQFSSIELQTLTIGMPKEFLMQNENEIFQVGEQPFFENLKYLFSEASALKLNVDLTLGSGWSSGGPFIRDFPAQQLIKSELEIIGPNNGIIKPPKIEEPSYIKKTNLIVNKTIGKFDQDIDLIKVVLARVRQSSKKDFLTEFKDVSNLLNEDGLKLDVPKGKYKLFFLYQNDVSHNTLGSAYKGALTESLVLDHLNKGGIEEYIEKLGNNWIEKIQPYKPRSFFIDSFELIGEIPWSQKFFKTFEEMHDYSIAPYLPLIFKKNGESKYLHAIFGEEFLYKSEDNLSKRVYEDYLHTREQLFMTEFLLPLKNWTSSLNIKLRLQAHGGFANYLDAYAIADIPESEGLFAGGSFDFLKLASSAGNIANRKIISSESFIKIDFDYNRLKTQDYERLAGNAFAAGINQIVFHGYPYEFSF